MKWTVTKISDLPLQTCLVGSLMFFGLCAGPLGQLLVLIRFVCVRQVRYLLDLLLLLLKP